MSSSTAPQTLVDSGECVVCGQVTTTRCSSCASHGTGWMYFCSREHQKLVWSAHKRTCGINSSPFQWPLLTKAERSEVLEFHDAHRASSQGEIHRWEEMCTRLGTTLSIYLDVIGDDVDGDPSKQQSMTSSVVSARADHFNRKTELLFEPSGKKDSALHQLITDDPYGFVAAIVVQVWGKFATLKKQYSSWSELCHRLLVFIAANYGCQKSGILPRPQDQLSVYSRRAIEAVGKEGASHPDSALYLTKLLDALFPL